MGNNNLLEIKGIVKEFPGVKAVNNVSLNIKSQSIHGLVGENGAGKSTLMKILMGIHKSDKGKILFKGQEVSINSPSDALDIGISMIHQELASIRDMTVSENIFLKREPKKNKIFIDRKKLKEKTRNLLKRLDLDINPNTKMRDLSVAKMQMVEIVKAISYDVDLIIMDEPTSTLGDNEVERLFDLMTTVKNNGTSMIFVTHKLEEILEITDEVSVLRDGNHVATAKTEDLNRDKIIHYMIGRKSKDFPDIKSKKGDTLLTVKNFANPPYFKEVNFTLKEGEIIGIFGLVGSGRSEFLETLFGVDNKKKGVLQIKGQEVNIYSPQDAIDNGMAFVPEDRKESGLVLQRSLQENITLTTLKNYLNFNIFVDKKEERKIIDKYIDKLDIRCHSPKQVVKYLSGGNQQKVIIGKWLATRPDILILDEPTRGIDVGAKEEIYTLIKEYAEEGMGIIMVSSEMPEIIGLSDKVVVFKRGMKSYTIEDVPEDKEILEEKIMNMAV